MRLASSSRGSEAAATDQRPIAPSPISSREIFPGYTGCLLPSAFTPTGNPSYYSSKSPGAIPLDTRRRGAATSAPSWRDPRGAGPGGGAPARCSLGGPKSKFTRVMKQNEFPPRPDDSPHAIAPRPKWVPVESASTELS